MEYAQIPGTHTLISGTDWAKQSATERIKPMECGGIADPGDVSQVDPGDAPRRQTLTVFDMEVDMVVFHGEADMRIEVVGQPAGIRELQDPNRPANHRKRHLVDLPTPTNKQAFPDHQSGTTDSLTGRTPTPNQHTQWPSDHHSPRHPSCLPPLNQASGYQLVDGIGSLDGGQTPAGQTAGVGHAVRAGQQRQIDADRRIRHPRCTG